MPLHTDPATKDFTILLPGDIPLDMVFVQGNMDAPEPFMMGSMDEDKGAKNDEKPAYPVRLNSFWLSRYPITQKQWQAVLGVGNNPSRFKGENKPIEYVCWYDAVVFCNALSNCTGKSLIYYTDRDYKIPFGKSTSGWSKPTAGDVFLKKEKTGFRLPTEAEWEYAARGGIFWQKESYLYVGSDLLEQVGWYYQNSKKETHEVGLLLPNTLGLCDMSGNVYEWCQDWYKIDYYDECFRTSLIQNPVGPESGFSRVCRGGYWYELAQYCRASSRYAWAPGDRDYQTGFRPLLTLAIS